jgi:hypothetical protein
VIGVTSREFVGLFDLHLSQVRVVQPLAEDRRVRRRAFTLHVAQERAERAETVTARLKSSSPASELDHGVKKPVQSSWIALIR